MPSIITRLPCDCLRPKVRSSHRVKEGTRKHDVDDDVTLSESDLLGRRNLMAFSY